MTMILWKIFISFLEFHWWFQFLEKKLILFKKVTSNKKLPIGDDKSFLE